MNRRALLAAVGTSLLAGCSSRSDSTDPVATPSTPDPVPTPPANVTTVSETKPIPTPSDVRSRETARSFVGTYEEHYVYNDLVDGGRVRQHDAATDVDVDPAQVAVVDASADGYYLLSACRGTAEYYSPGRSSRGGGRNAVAVAHYVDATTHRRVPFNFYSCEQSVVTVATPERTDVPPARLQIYDFDTPVDYDRPDDGGHRVDVTVTDPGGERVLDEAYQTALPLTVQPGVTETTGTHRLAASLPDGESVTHEWDLTSPTDPSWWATALVVTNGGGLTVQQFYPNDAVGLPKRTLCGRRR